MPTRYPFALRDQACLSTPLQKISPPLNNHYNRKSSKNKEKSNDKNRQRGEKMKGIGVDIVEITRIKEIKNKEKFIKKILSTEEQTTYTTLKNEKRQLEYLAGRFAIKEAIYKAAPALCTGKNFTDFSILNTSTGAPYLAKPNVSEIMITLSHSENYVVAFVAYH